MPKQPIKDYYAKQNKRTRAQIDRDLSIISKWFRQGMRLVDITNRLNEITMAEDGYTLTSVMISKDLKQLVENWKQEHREHINSKMEIEIAKLDLIEAEMWEAWEQSKNGERKTKMVAAKDGSGRETQVFENGIHTSSAGDVAYISRIQWCIEMRAKILGYITFVPTEDPGKSKYGEVWDSSIEDIQKEMNKLYTRSKIAALSKGIN